MKRLFGNLSKTIFAIALSVYIFLFLFILLVPTAGEMVTAVLDFTLSQIGWFYVLAYAAIVVAFLAIGMSKYGKLRLGNNGDKPEYSFFSWMGMLVGAGIGCGFVFYGVNEPVTHFLSAPFAEPGTTQAAADSMRATFFHWSFLPWAIYGTTGLCIGYFMYRKGLPGLVSSTFRPMLGNKTSAAPGRLIDAFSVIAVICGVSMSLGFAATQLSSGLEYIYGIPATFGVIALIILIISALSTLSAIGGIAKGIKLVGDINMYVIILLLVFALLTGPTLFIVKVFFQTMGDLLYNLPWMILFTDSWQQITQHTGFDWVSGWTEFYWAWWVAFAPFVGSFLAKISRGRTIREFTIACTVVPGILSCIWMATFGGSAIEMTLFNGSDVALRAAENVNSSFFIFLKELPFSIITIPISIVLITTLIITSVNAGTYEAGAMTSGGSYVPSLGLRAFWGAFICLNAILFFSINGLATLKNIAVVLALPFIIILLFMIANLLMDLRRSTK